MYLWNVSVLSSNTYNVSSQMWKRTSRSRWNVEVLGLNLISDWKPKVSVTSRSRAPRSHLHYWLMQTDCQCRNMQQKQQLIPVMIPVIHRCIQCRPNAEQLDEWPAWLQIRRKPVQDMARHTDRMLKMSDYRCMVDVIKHGRLVNSDEDCWPVIVEDFVHIIGDS